MNNTTNSWEGEAWIKEFDEEVPMTLTLKEERWFKDFIRTLLHDTEIAAREEATNETWKSINPGWAGIAAEAIEQARKEAREEIKKEIDLAITQIHGGGNGRRLLEQLRDALSH